MQNKKIKLCTILVILISSMMCRCCSGCCFFCSICCAKCAPKSNKIDLSDGNTPQSQGDTNALTKPKPSNLVKIGQNLASTVSAINEV